MRTFIADHAGANLGDAITHWHATRSADPRPIDAQFELNRFTRQWYFDHPRRHPHPPTNAHTPELSNYPFTAVDLDPLG